MLFICICILNVGLRINCKLMQQLYTLRLKYLLILLLFPTFNLEIIFKYQKNMMEFDLCKFWKIILHAERNHLLRKMFAVTRCLRTRTAEFLVCTYF